jgi:hypothetical protein
MKKVFILFFLYKILHDEFNFKIVNDLKWLFISSRTERLI